MIRSVCARKPAGFVEKVERPGKRWLAAHDRGRPRDLWSPFKPQLADAFQNLCAYGAMYEPVGTIDHFVSVDEDRRRAYDWRNYRYCSAWVNSSKQRLSSAEVLDPFLVQDGWFEVILPSLQLVVADDMPRKYRARAEGMLTRLHLRDDERVMRQRRMWLKMYDMGSLTLEGLAEHAPLIARAVKKREDGEAKRAKARRPAVSRDRRPAKR
jgi:hypothetical protein